MKVTLCIPNVKVGLTQQKKQQQHPHHRGEGEYHILQGVALVVDDIN